MTQKFSSLEAITVTRPINAVSTYITLYVSQSEHPLAAFKNLMSVAVILYTSAFRRVQHSFIWAK